MSILIFDAGSSMMKAGFEGQEKPMIYQPTIVGREKLDETKICFGEDIYENLKSNRLSYPVENGIVTKWDDMQQLMGFTISKLKVDPAKTSFFITEPARNPVANRQKYCELAFEKFGFNSFMVQHQPVLTLFSVGDNSGLVIDSGSAVTSVVPVYEGFVLAHATQRENFGGRQLTNYLSKLLKSQESRSFSTLSQLLVLDTIKTQICSVFVRGKDSKIEPVTYQLPDGSELSCKSAHVEACELLFDPEMDDIEVPPISEMFKKSISECAIDVRKKLYQTIFLSGGNTMLKNFQPRLQQELTEVVPQGVQLKIASAEPGEKPMATFLGASMLALMTTYEESALSKKEYSEEGIAALRKKFKL